MCCHKCGDSYSNSVRSPNTSYKAGNDQHAWSVNPSRNPLILQSLWRIEPTNARPAMHLIWATAKHLCTLHQSKQEIVSPHFSVLGKVFREIRALKFQSKQKITNWIETVICWFERGMRGPIKAKNKRQGATVSQTAGQEVSDGDTLPSFQRCGHHSAAHHQKTSPSRTPPPAPPLPPRCGHYYKILAITEAAVPLGV